MKKYTVRKQIIETAAEIDRLRMSLKYLPADPEGTLEKLKDAEWHMDNLLDERMGEIAYENGEL